jgi:hypothetical protein
MQKWIAFLLSGALALAFVVGLFIQPLDSEANSTSYWHAEFFDNTELNGAPIYTRSDREVNFNWAIEAPAPGVPVDQFSVRWSGTFDFDAGLYEFSVGTDDGARLWINDKLVIDRWVVGNDDYAVLKEVVELGRGSHDLRLEYFDAQELAGVHIHWEPTDAVPPAPANEDAGPEVEPAQQGDENRAVANVATGVLNVRSGPAIQYERITQIFLYQRYRILGQTAGSTWYQIDLRDGRLGWVAARFVIVTGSGEIPVVNVEVAPPQEVFSGATGVAVFRLNVRPAPTTDNEPFTFLNYLQEVTVLGRDSTSVWYLIRFDDELFGETEGWVFAPYISLRGVPAFDIPFVE